jgi:hypothetical protein
MRLGGKKGFIPLLEFLVCCQGHWITLWFWLYNPLPLWRAGSRTGEYFLLFSVCFSVVFSCVVTLLWFMMLFLSFSFQNIAPPLLPWLSTFMESNMRNLYATILSHVLCLLVSFARDSVLCVCVCVCVCVHEILYLVTSNFFSLSFNYWEKFSFLILDIFFIFHLKCFYSKIN